MKRLILILTVLFATINIMAQEHLSFKGIPIQGSLTEFCNKIKNKGFTVTSIDNDITVFSGDFTGRKVSVAVTATNDGQNVFGIVLVFDSSEEWNTLVSTYDYYKNLYTRKYGEPKVSRENNPARTDSNNSLMREVDQGTVTYSSVWEVTGGDIELSIQKAPSVYTGVVVISYKDSQNMEAKIQNDLEDI